ncbi:hypothetical protein COCC4DRAFT_163263 [Bipolaris maydis ATCC 48331]|uniref:NTF2 domain-containing protein n=2 Tax=Cochliobolus heterostrophus TaxID=5016 RepID=M2V2Q9_COCH5|nr:uncharacterized protein COCC4DRAFT_163263 [Bipolaris maydis ATCC 48331]EMD94298.1 hypothetical protein COCHEDRAFT_1170198 [Bipolaris maydis C5]KAH7563904.1 hypothetical protein BM1_00951 [Bipolaris maydis]ENI07404.1 hypothetical protein COCC4DRAFT_163263 [Bipolaris maydis ATCC 48331]KAJ5026533.1 hypothetical protein J3E73DRAFT_423276 [Bipolaris maydis]KAJ5059742.1 hypothetical protein J3E74DRAFT_419194 [Bipolaris maydis]
MTLRDTYAKFLATPSTGALAENATLHYVSTTTSISDATAIIKHLSVQEKLLKKTKQNILDAVEGSRALSVDVETTVEFSNGGGAYLPGLDDNFVADRTATFPMVHVVHFDHAGKITQIRQYWDQGSLLKQIDVIGARSRNWPIRDASEQIRLISNNASASQPESAASSRPTTAASRGADEVSISSRSQRSTSNAMNDPHASLSLFAPRETEEEPTYTGQPGAPRAQSAKPPPREYSELFATAEGGSPTPSQKIPAKSGAGKNYKPNRLFEEDDDESVTSAPSSVKTNSKKYDHFQFGDGEETPKAPEALRPRQNQLRTKNSAHWDFDDFATPDKAKPKTHPQAVRHFGWSDDEDDVSPVRRPIVHKARPDADAHFEFNDDATPEGQRARPVKSKLGNKGQGLYDDHVTNTTDDSPGVGKKENIKSSQAVRSSMKTHWGMHADSPENRGINIAGNGMGGRKGTEAAWSLFDESPAKKESTGKQVGIKTEGDGMGGRKTADKSFWDF